MSDKDYVLVNMFHKTMLVDARYNTASFKSFCLKLKDAKNHDVISFTDKEIEDYLEATRQNSTIYPL